MSRIPAGQAARILGTPAPKLLGEGMEGAVYEIDESHVAKLWFSASAQALGRMATFYDALDAKRFTFAVPRIVRVDTVEDRVVTIERRLAGATLSSAVKAGADAYPQIIDVIGQLAGGGDLPAGRALAVLGEITPLFTAEEAFPVALARLVERRVERFRPVLSRAVHRLDEKAAALVDRLRDVDSGRRAVVHGDLFPGNVLVDEAGRASAVLDWGFLTTEGDPAFDAAVAAAVFDMYGPEAAQVEQTLLRRIEQRMGYDHTALLVYRAAYSLITANAYDPTGNDGHFAWCVAALNRADITQALT